MPADDPFAEWLAAISLAPGPLAIHDALDAVDVESFADAQVPLSQSKSQPLGMAFVFAEIERHGAHDAWKFQRDAVLDSLQNVFAWGNSFVPPI